MPSFDDIIAALKGGKPQPDAMPFGVGGPAEPVAEPTNVINPLVGSLAQKTMDVPKHLIDAAAQFDPNDIHGSTQRVVPAATDAAMGLIGRGVAAPTAGLGAFGGKLAKTADLRQLDAAMTRSARGANPDQTRLLTGWEQHPIDQQWRFEIPDNKLAMKFMPEKRGQTATGSIDAMVSHPELMKAYPDLKGLRLDLSKTVPEGAKNPYVTPAGASGSYYPPRKGGAVPARFEVDAPNYSDARSVVSHELQHGIQNIEGFAQGGDPAQFIPHFEKIMRQNEVPVYDHDRLTALAHQAYHNIAGEVEARNVQNRLNFSPLRRLTEPPVLTQDVPFHEQYDVNKMIELLKSRAK